MIWKPACNFFFGFLQCTLPMDTIDVELTVRTMSKVFIPSEKIILQNHPPAAPGSKWMKPFPSLWNKTEAFDEEKKDRNSPFHVLIPQNSWRSPQRNLPSQRDPGNNPQEKRKIQNKKAGHEQVCNPPKAKRLAKPVGPCQSNSGHNHQCYSYKCKPQDEHYYQPHNNIHLQDMQEIGTIMPIPVQICSESLTPGVRLVWQRLGQWQTEMTEQKKKVDSPCCHH